MTLRFWFGLVNLFVISKVTALQRFIYRVDSHIFMKHLLNVSYSVAFYKIVKYNNIPVSKKLIIKQWLQWLVTRYCNKR